MDHPHHPSTPRTVERPDDRHRFARRGLLVGVPAVWIAVAFSHPVANVETLYEDLRGKVVIWMTVHFLQLVLSLGLAAGLWISVRGRQGPAATVARCAIPVYLVFFAAFDSITGIASGLAIHHANSLTGPAHEGAMATAEYLLDNRFTADLSPTWAIGQTALVTAIAATAMCLRRAGVSRAAWGTVLAGVLTSMHAGPPAAIGLALLAYGLVRADRERHLVQEA
jgi:hypothetical protein